MLARGFPPTYLLGVLVGISLVFFFTFTYGAPRFTEQAIQHEIKKPTAPAQKVPPSSSNETEAPAQSPANKALFAWKNRAEDYPIPVESLIPLPKGGLASIPTIQFNFTPVADEEYNKRLGEKRDEVKKALKRCWNGYKAFAYGRDELAVESAKGRDRFGGWGATLVDSLDTLWVTDMKPEFEEAVLYLKTVDFGWTGEKEINTYETTIRHLGGLLSAHDLTDGKYPILLEKAVELAQVLYASFDTPNRMPITRWEWKNARDGVTQEAATAVHLAEIGSFSLEFTRLSQVTGDTKYYDAVQRVSDQLEKKQNSTKIPGLWPTVINAKFLDNMVEFNQFTLSSMADSTLEYLPKQYMLLGGQLTQPQTMYEAAIEAAKINLFYRPMTKDKKDILISGSATVEKLGEITLHPEGQHVACYLAGTIGVGSQIFDRKDDLPIARKLMDGCLWASENTPTGIMPELFHTIPCPKDTECEWEEKRWVDDVLRRHKSLGFTDENVDWKIREHRIDPGFADIPDRRYQLRPEVIESLFVLYRITGDEAIRDRAWRLWETIEKVTATRYGNAVVEDVTTGPFPEHTDFMESFWTAETIKYFYLMFCDQSVLSLDEWVFNTEGHPFKRPT